MKTSVVPIKLILGLVFLTLSNLSAQISGNQVYGNSNYNAHNYNAEALPNNSVVAINDNVLTVSVKILCNKKADGFVMTLGLNEEDAPRASWARYIFGVCREMMKRGVDVKGFNTAFAGDVPLGAGMSSSAALESTYAYALNDLFGDNKIDKFELAKVGQSTEHNYCGVNCGIMDQFASVFGKKGSLIRLDCRSLEYQYFPFDPQGYRLVLVDSVVKHELASSAYNKRRQSCEAAVAAVQKKHPHVEFLRDVTMGMLEEAKADISAEDYMRAEYVIEEIQRVLDVCDALEKGDYETVGQKMYETHHGMSKLYEVSCEELDFLNDLAFDCGVTGSRVMGGGFGGCTINLVKDELYSTFIEKAKDEFKKKFGRSPKVYDVVISDGARRLE